MKIKNVSEGPRGINLKDGSFLLEVGQEIDGELTADERKSAEKTGWFTFGAAAEAPKKPEDMTADELKTLLTERGVQFPADAKKDDLVKLANK